MSRDPMLQGHMPPPQYIARRSANDKLNVTSTLERHRRRCVWPAFVLCAAVTIGCSRSDGLVQIYGTVTLDSQPIAEGLIAFVPVAGDTAKAEAVIQNGTYSVGVMPGEKIVQIRGFKTVGQEHAVKGNPNSPLLPIRKDIVPTKYNQQSELKRDVTFQSSIENFDLTST